MGEWAEIGEGGGDSGMPEKETVSGWRASRPGVQILLRVPLPPNTQGVGVLKQMKGICK